MLSDEELGRESVDGEWTLEPALVADWDEDTDGYVSNTVRLLPVNTDHRAELAEQFALWFKRERGFDFVPFEKGDQEEVVRHVYLINSHEFLRMVPVAVGAVEIRDVGDSAVLMWCWLHPFERGSIWREAWQELVKRHGDLKLQAPLSGAMQSFRRRMKIPDDRVVVVH